MLCSISKINIPIPHSGKRVDIQLDGKSLIITGSNGCGKTSFITAIYEFLKKGIDDQNNNDTQHLTTQIYNFEQQMKRIGRDAENYNTYNSLIKKHKARLEEISNFNIETNSIDNNDIRSLLRFHNATRQSAISSPNQTPKYSILFEENKHFSNEKDGSKFFESYLLSLKKNQSYAIAFDKDENEASRISKWFDKIQSDLRSLFEDPYLSLEFDTKMKNFIYIKMEKINILFKLYQLGIPQY